MIAPLNRLQEFLRLESAAGIVLMAAAAAALVCSNSPLAGLYEALFDVHLTVEVGGQGIDKPLLLWVNDGLMAVFFLLVGLEVKREILEGELSTPAQVVLPAIGAAGGFVLPALIFVAFNRGDGAALHGWAIPSATDIAFALGVLSLLGERVPLSLKVFLTSLAIFDDLAAVLVIAVFYTSDLSVVALSGGALGTAVLVALNRAGIRAITPYAIVGLAIWVCVLKSGVHATLAGVIVAGAIPIAPDDHGHSPLESLEHALHPWVAFAVLPLFAFANAGVPLLDMPLALVLDPITLGIAAGLFFGKQIGVFVPCWLAVRFGLARLPDGASWRSFYGIALLSGIGFTMSLFIGNLAFEHGGFDALAATRVGVLAGSVASALLGVLVLRRATAAGT